MRSLSRITPAMLDVLSVLVWSPEALHGFALAKVAGRPTGSVYIILNRLEDAGWVDSYWEPINAQAEGRPRRRFYRLNPDGLGAARQLLAERRNQVEAKSGNARKHRGSRGVLPGVLGRTQ
jgi:PadR family transcriptional regulator PadR